MARALSIDLRERVLRDVLSGGAIRSIASRFEVSASFVSKLHKRYRETGSVEPARQGVDRWSHLIEAHAEWILQTVEGPPTRRTAPWPSVSRARRQPAARPAPYRGSAGSLT